MEGNVCDVSHLDDDVLMPPRKRLLAGMKKQNSNDQSHASTSASPPTPSEVDTYFKTLSSSYSSATSSSSLEEIVESSKKAALAAAEVAEAARVTVEEKAAGAARAIAAAKSALELVAAFSDETSRRDGRSKKSKSKKQVTVQSLYNKHDEVDNDITDDEITRNSHNISNHSLSAECKSPKEDSQAIYNENGTLDTEGSSPEVLTFIVQGSNHFKEKSSETADDSYPNGKNRARIKLQNMPLSICSRKDQGNSCELTQPSYGSGGSKEQNSCRQRRTFASH